MDGGGRKRVPAGRDDWVTGHPPASRLRFTGKRKSSTLQITATTLICLLVPVAIYGLLAGQIQEPYDPCLWERTFLFPVYVVRPEVLERTTYLLSILLTPVAALIVYALFGRVASGLSQRTLRICSAAAALAGCIAVVLVVRRFPADVLFLEFVLPRAMRSIMAWFLPLVAWVVIALAFLVSRSKWNRLLNWAPIAIGILLGPVSLRLAFSMPTGSTILTISPAISTRRSTRWHRWLRAVDSWWT
jgi:hypothetical protein